MPLTEVIRVLNSLRPPPLPGLHPTNPFVLSEGRALLYYAGLRLISRFLPFSNRAGRVCGHVAALAAAGPGYRLELGAGAVFALPAGPEEVACLDSLVRTLHTLNYLIHPQAGHLVVKVRPGAAMAPSLRRGLAFGDVLRASGLLPHRLSLEIDESGDWRPEDLAAVRAKGYGLAVGPFGRNGTDFERLQAIAPEIVRLDPMLLPAGTVLNRIVARLHQQSALVMADIGEDSARPPGSPFACIDLLLSRPDFISVGLPAAHGAGQGPLPASRSQPGERPGAVGG